MIGQKAALMTANLAVGTLLGLVAAILIGRYFDPFHVGQLNYAISLAGLLFFMTDLGMGQAHVKRVSEGRDPGDCFATYAVFKVVMTMVFVATIATGLWIYLVVLDRPLEDTTLPIILLVVGYYVARALADIGQSSFDARLETAKSQLAQLTDTVLRVGLSIAFAIIMAATFHFVPWAQRLVPEGFGAWIRADPGFALAVATLVGALGAAVVSLTLLVRTLERGHFRWALLKDYASFALPLFVSFSIVLISLYVDGAMLGFFRGAADVGIFAQVRRLPMVLSSFGTMLSALLFPAVSMMLARGDHEGVKKTADGGLRYLSLLLVPAALFTAAFSHDVIRLTIGEQWLAGAAALALLSIGVVVASFGHAHSFLLLGLGRPDLAARVAIVSAVVLVGLNLLLIPDDIKSLGLPLAGMGLTGAAIATLVSNFVWYGGTRYYTATVGGYQESSHLWRHLAGAALMVGALLALDATVLPLVRWYHFLAFVTIGTIIYGAALVALREIRQSDLDFVRRVLHPREMMRYVAGEIRQKKE